LALFFVFGFFFSVFDPSGPSQNTWYVCVFSGWGGAPNGLGGLYLTTNRGGSWTKLTGSQFDRVTSITLNPTASAEAYLTTETQGLWVSENMNNATPSWTLVGSYPFRQPERVFFNPFNANELWVSSFGNGMKMATLSGVLPLQLVSFSGNHQQAITQLQWVTANEVAGDHFEVERSLNGQQFDKVGSVIAMGSGSQQYHFTETVSASVLYYRLHIFHNAGSSTYSNVLIFRENSSYITDARLLVNPVTASIHLQVTVPLADKLQITLTDLSGRQQAQQVMNVSTGITQFEIPLPASAVAGVYVLRINGNQIKKSLRVLKSGL